MRAIRVACGQFQAGSLSDNVAIMRDQAAEAGSRGAAIIVFPELALTGYLPAPEVLDHCQPLDGDGVEGMREVAREHGIAIVFGLPELTEGVRYNTMLALDATGTIAGIYRKIHLWKTEDWAQPGTSIEPYELAGVTCASWICYDTRFPEIGRAAALAGADLCVISTAWLGPGDEWELAVRSRALDNTVFVAGSDIINPDPSLRPAVAASSSAPRATCWRAPPRIRRASSSPTSIPRNSRRRRTVCRCSTTGAWKRSWICKRAVNPGQAAVGGGLIPRPGDLAARRLSEDTPCRSASIGLVSA